ncbi:hypothetical protein RJ640_013875 [Escallonia rubra]|uniref:Uncharacterized protein n=1 Tax=Escallonia rubra TaxID=112253 RepID=A0AA88QR14_9ASTE|nr:hypothetical protein RJ640_013875 [Escallonia rubra]
MKKTCSSTTMQSHHHLLVLVSLLLFLLTATTSSTQSSVDQNLPESSVINRRFEQYRHSCNAIFARTPPPSPICKLSHCRPLPVTPPPPPLDDGDEIDPRYGDTSEINDFRIYCDIMDVV